MKQNNAFLSYIHNFRGIAIFYIVAGHCISAFDWQYAPFLGRIIRMLLGNGTVFFVFIAGYLFQYLSHKYKPKKYLFTKLTTVLLPYLLVSIPAIVYFVFFQQRETVWPGFYDNPHWLQVIYFYLTGLHLAPFWFIPMICLFYIISPVLYALDKHKVSYLLLPFLILLSCNYPRGDVLQSFVHFLSVYFFGMYLSHYRESINGFLIKATTIFLLTAIYLSLLYFEYIFENIVYLNFIRKLILCCIFIGLLLVFDIKYKPLELLAEWSFGIFFIHSYIITLFKLTEQKFLGHILIGNIPLFIFFVALIFSICLLIVGLLKKIFGNKTKYIIGC